MTGQVSTSRFDHGRLSLAYTRWECGSEVSLAFHGFGQCAADFELLAEHKKIDLIAFDLFFHGESRSEVDPQLGLPSEEWSSYISEFLTALQLKKVHLIAYSMGARLAMSLVDSIPGSVNSLTLIAPDGFTVNPWYRLAVRTRGGQVLFKNLYSHSRWLLNLAALLVRFKLLSASTLKLAKLHIATPDACEQLYNSWMFLRKIHPDVDSVGRKLEMVSIPLKVHLGEFDKVVVKSKVLKWSVLQNQGVGLVIHQQGHALLVPSVFKAL